MQSCNFEVSKRTIVPSMCKCDFYNQSFAVLQIITKWFRIPGHKDSSVKKNDNAKFPSFQNCRFSFLLGLALLHPICKPEDYPFFSEWVGEWVSEWNVHLFWRHALIFVQKLQEFALQQKRTLNIDNSPRLNETFLMPLIQHLMPNVPLELWEENKEKGWFSNPSCGRWQRTTNQLMISPLTRFPSIFDLKYNSRYWQQLNTPK